MVLLYWVVWSEVNSSTLSIPQVFPQKEQNTAWLYHKLFEMCHNIKLHFKIQCISLGSFHFHMVHFFTNKKTLTKTVRNSEKLSRPIFYNWYINMYVKFKKLRFQIFFPNLALTKYKIHNVTSNSMSIQPFATEI